MGWPQSLRLVGVPSIQKTAPSPDCHGTGRGCGRGRAGLKSQPLPGPVVVGRHSKLGTGATIGLGFGFKGKSLNEAPGEAASLLSDTGHRGRIGEVIV